jgi:TPR repeat protein
VELDEGARFCKLSADQEDSHGQYEYGVCLESGKGVDQDVVEAAKSYKRSCDGGDHFGGQWRYGIQMLEGKANCPNPVEAAQYFKSSAEYDFANGQFLYGLCCKDGIGVPVDVKEANVQLNRAASQGHAMAKFTFWLLEDGE